MKIKKRIIILNICLSMLLLLFLPNEVKAADISIAVHFSNGVDLGKGIRQFSKEDEKIEFYISNLSESTIKAGGVYLIMNDKSVVIARDTIYAKENGACKIDNPGIAGSYTLVIKYGQENTPNYRETRASYKVTGESAFKWAGAEYMVASDSNKSIMGVKVYWEYNELQVVSGSAVSGFKASREKIDGSGRVQITDVSQDAVYKNTFSVTDMNVENGSYIYSIEKNKERYKIYVNVNNESKLSGEESYTWGNDKIALTIDIPTFSINGELRYIDVNHEVSPKIKDGRTVLPIRSIVEAMNNVSKNELGKSNFVLWDEDSKAIDVKYMGTTVLMKVGSTKAYVVNVNGERDELELPLAPYIDNGRTLVPIRVLEALKCRINWDDINRKVTISYPISKLN